MNKKYTKFYIVLFLNAINLASCYNIDKKNTVKESESNKIISSQKSMILHKEIKAIRVILDSLDLANKVIFLYNGFDCETCIDIGYDICRNIDSISKKQTTYIISTSANISRDQLKNDYHYYIYNDEHDLIRKEINYIYTPILIKIDSSFTVSNVFFPNAIRNRIKETEFIKQCTN